MNSAPHHSVLPPVTLHPDLWISLPVESRVSALSIIVSGDKVQNYSGNKTGTYRCQSSKSIASNWLVFGLLIAIGGLAGGCRSIHDHPPYPDVDKLVTIRKVILPNKAEPILGSDVREWRQRSQTLTQIAMFRGGGRVLSDMEIPERLNCAVVSADFFAVLGAQPLVGRVFIPDEFQSGNHRTVLISNSLWQRRFNGDPNIIGKTMVLDQESYVVIGVMPPNFEFPVSEVLPEAWLPLTPEAENLRPEDTRPRLPPKGGIEITITGSPFGLQVIARLKPGIARSQAQAEMDKIARDMEKEYPESSSGRSIRLQPLHECLFPWMY